MQLGFIAEGSSSPLNVCGQIEKAREEKSVCELTRREMKNCAGAVQTPEEWDAEGKKKKK